MAKRSSRRDDRQKVSARHRAENRKSGLDFTTLSVPEGVQLFRLDKAGIRRVDLLPYRVGSENPWAEEGELHYERTYWMHRGIGTNNDSYVCPRKTTGGKCPICEYVDKLRKDPDADEDAIKDLGPKERQLFNVIDLADTDKGVQVWDISFHLFGKRLDAEIRNLDDDENDLEYFADLADGSTLKLGISERSFAGNTFYEVETIGFKARRKPYDESILDDVNDLDAMLKVEGYDKLKSIFLQTEEDGPEEEVTAPEKKKTETKPKASRKTTTKKNEPKEPTAEDAGIKVGMEVEHEDHGICTVRRISDDGTSLTLIDADDDIHKGVGVDEVAVKEATDEKPPKGKKTGKKKEETPKDDPPDDDDDPPDDDDDDWDDDDDDDWGDDD